MSPGSRQKRRRRSSIRWQEPPDLRRWELPVQQEVRKSTNGDLFDDSNAKVGHVASSCTVVSVPPRATEVACLSDTVLAQGKITVGGVAPFPPTATPVRFSVLGGTDEFRKARGDFVVFAVPPNRLDGTFHLLD